MRKSDKELQTKINEAFEKLYKEGKMQEISKNGSVMTKSLSNSAIDSRFKFLYNLNYKCRSRISDRARQKG